MAKGGAVEVESAGEWWEATISKVRDDKIKVHYVGGTEDEDEWIQLKRFERTRPGTARQCPHSPLSRALPRKPSPSA